MTTKETANDVDEHSVSHIGPEPPIRILCQTLTHLVPGLDSFERNRFVLNLMCQHHWKCDFHRPRFRWASYNERWALDNQRCFFLVDYGESENDENVPILFYEWTGELIKPLPQLANDHKIQTALKKDFPFTWQPSKHGKRPVRSLVKMRLYDGDNVPIREMDYLRDHPEDVQWLRTHVRPRFWQKFVTRFNETKPPGSPDLTINQGGQAQDSPQQGAAIATDIHYA